MIKFSVVIITCNEEKNIGRCLQSVQDIADEIVVVDSHSTNQTSLICGIQTEETNQKYRKAFLMKRSEKDKAF